MPTDPDTLLSKASSHALGYRNTLANHQRPPSADDHAKLERISETMREHGTPAGEVSDDWVMRLSVSSGATTARDVERSAEAIVGAWRAVRRGGPLT